MRRTDLKLNELLASDISESDQERQLEELRTSALPVLVFGSGGYARMVTEFLARHQVEVDGYCESESYYKKGKDVWGKPVYCVHMLPEIIPEYNLVIGASGKGVPQFIAEEEANGTRVFVFNAAKPFFTMTCDWIHRNLEGLQQTFSMLEDDLSRETFLAVLDNNAHCVKIPVRPLWRLWIEDQYFNSLFHPQDYECHTLIDCGAYIGDSAEEYLSQLREKGIEGRVYSFEPDREHYQKLMQTAKRLKGIQTFPYAVGNQNKRVLFCMGKDGISHISTDENDEWVEMVRVDDLLGNEKISFVKMDIEGGEEDALLGMRNIIRNQTPMLAICVYHRIDDLIRIPQCIERIMDGSDVRYNYYLRHHTTSVYDTVLYAVRD